MKRFVCVVMALALAGTGCGKKLVTVSLAPSNVHITIDQTEDHENFVCGVPCGINLLTSCTTENIKLFPDPGSVMVGYSRGYKEGTPPCDCWAWASCTFRGYVAFDLGALPSTDILSAELSWFTNTQKQVGGTASNFGTCVKDLYVAQAPWKLGQKIPGDALVITDPNGPVDVSKQVRQWAMGQLPNYGLFFVGLDESLPAKSHDYCKTQLSGFKLEVETWVPN